MFQCAVATTVEVPMQNSITLAMRSSDTPYFDDSIEIARRSMESKALLKSTKMMVVIRFDTRHMSRMQRKAIVCSTVDRPAQKPLWSPNNCGSMTSCVRARTSLFVSLAKAQLFAIPRWFSRDYELPFLGMETIILCFHLSETVLSLLLRI